MVQALLDRRQEVMARVMQVREDNWPERNGADYINQMEAAAGELAEIAELLRQNAAPRLEQSRTHAYIGSVRSEMEPALGKKALDLAMQAFGIAEGYLRGDEDPIYLASLDFNIANTLRQIPGMDLGIVVEAWQRLSRALAAFTAANHERVTMTRESLDMVEGMLPGIIMFNGLDLDSPEVKLLDQRITEHGRITPELMPLLQEAIKVSGGSAVMATKAWTVADNLPPELTASSGYEKIKKELDMVLLSVLPPDQMLLFQKLKEKFETDIREGRLEGDRAENSMSSIREIFAIMAANQGGEKGYQGEAHAMGDLIQSQARNLHYAQKPPDGTRAARLYDLCFGFKTYFIEQQKRGTQENEGRRLMELNRQVVETSARIRKIRDDEHAAKIERESFRPLAARVRTFSARKNPMLARPKWGVAEAMDADLVYVSGSAATHELVEAASRPSGLVLTRPPSGVESVAQSRWRQIQSALTTVFNLDRTLPPAALAAVAYELGIASALGKPRVVVQPAGQAPLFDVDVFPVGLSGNVQSDRATLADALDRSICWTHPQHQTLGYKETVAFAEARYAGNVTTLQLLALRELIDDQDDPLDTCRHLDSLVRLLNDGATQLLFPLWPAAYPDLKSPMLFHILRLNPPEWVERNSQLAKTVCAARGMDYRRCDEPTNSDIIQAIWHGIATSSCLLADLTGFSANVAFELGIAHTLGKPALILFQHDGPADEISETLSAHFEMLARERFFTYRDPADAEAQIDAFVKSNG
ncbi:MAG: hypothetical protein KDH97_12970 [Calditrichaeota bacterium]|nr:hypothetical protein [Calditrichota bacterium]MCB0298124.1 hypothetical protein [Calditrichota bacterium]